VNSLTVGSLWDPSKLAFIPFVRARKGESKSVTTVHGGWRLMHGGLLAKLLDEG
jgi:hypothetical protein